MAYAYPAPRTGTAQDLFRVVTHAYELQLQRTGLSLPDKPESRRRWTEPLGRAAGVGVGLLLRVLPADVAVAFHDKLFRTLAGRSYPFDGRSGPLLRARELAGRLEREAGAAPALLAMISHPPVLGELSHLNLELVRHATLALRAARGRPCRPRLVVAIDPFALDTLSLAEESLYAGFMGSYHLGLDRMLKGRYAPGAGLLNPRAGWDAMPWRLLRLLARGGEAGLVPAGGVPSTGRVLYGAREWARRAAAGSPLRRDPKAALARLRAVPAFARFEDESAEFFPPPRGVWRRLEGWLMLSAAGLLPLQSAEEAGRAALEALDVPAAARASLLVELARDLGRETPSRARLFAALAARVARRRPLVLLPIAHRSSPLGIEARDAWSMSGAPGGRLRVRRAARPEEELEMTPQELAGRFIAENFA